MKAISFDDHEAGFIAMGARPVGVIAIGGMPVGVVAIGFASTGVLALSVGMSGGVVAISCGMHAGFWAGGVGMSIGLKTSTVGGGVEVLEVDEHVQETRKRTRFDDVAAHAVEPTALGVSASEGWVVVSPRRWEGDWRLEVGDRVVELEDAERKALGPLPKGELPRVAVHVRLVHAPDGATEAGYRAPPKQKLTLRCDDVALESLEVERVVTRERNYLGMLWKVPVWLAAMTVVAMLVYGAIDDLGLDRRATVTFAGRVRESNATDVPLGTPCKVTARLRTDGYARQKAAVGLECGPVTVYADGDDDRATIHQRSDDHGVPSFSLSYVNKGRKPDHSGDENDDGKPSISVDTEAREVIVAHTYPGPWRVVVDVEPWSSAPLEAVEARPLVEGTSVPAAASEIPPPTLGR
ncbi:MAG: hypothetical protein KC657_26780 [Myxococcales bacterium]|nr:hypothetical protein [Myxococcales bacterium]